MSRPEHKDEERAARVGAWLLADVLGPITAAFAYDAIVLQGRPSLRPVDKLGGP